jgi:hypothetical protein
MRWTEIIRVMTQPDREQEVARGLAEVIDDLKGSPDLRSATLYGRVAVPSDLSLHLSWDSAYVPDRGSELALSIVREFQPFGLLDHLLLLETRTYTPTVRRDQRGTPTPPRRGRSPDHKRSK